MITLSICVSDIPKEAITISQKNGKKYLSIVVDNLREVDKFGNTHCIKLSQTKEDRLNKVKPIYIGNGKEWVNQYATQTQPIKPSEQVNNNFNDSEDLPF